MDSSPKRPDLLAGCKVFFMGIGNTATSSLNGEQNALVTRKWKQWVSQAGGAFEAMGRM
ncbi:MAG: hypothetical protein SV765_14470 [Pseudomonadota bacterium]|nr:hypothetical protein [Pseudomonadota bacterium]